MRSVIDTVDLTVEELDDIIKTACDISENPKKYAEKCKGKKIYWCEGSRGNTGGQSGRAKARSKTFPSIAKAMAEQWAGYAAPVSANLPEMCGGHNE